MPKELISRKHYQKLLGSIRLEIERGIKQVEKLLEAQKVLTYWNIGRIINEFIKTHNLPHGAIGPFYQNLARDLGLHDRVLQQCSQFHL